MTRDLLFSIILLTYTNSLFSQDKEIEALRKSILEEGIFLFRLKKASWHATDILMLKHLHTVDSIKGYLSYTEDTKTKTIFWNSQNKIIMTINFDSLASENNAIVDDQRRIPTKHEEKLIRLKTLTDELLNKNEGAFFKFYENTNPNIIPIIRNNQRVVFILTGSQQNKLVIGNDYKLTFDSSGAVVEKSKLHNSLITIDQSNKDSRNAGSVHSHILKDYPLMTSTDICTFLLVS